jgi:hypothetical protein
MKILLQRTALAGLGLRFLRNVARQRFFQRLEFTAGKYAENPELLEET